VEFIMTIPATLDRRLPGSLRLLPVLAALTFMALSLTASAGGRGVRPGGGGFGTGSAESPSSTDEAFLFHVLNRVTYGPTLETVSEIREVGVDEFLRRQLHPQELDDAVLDAQLVADIPAVDSDFYQWNEFYYEHLVRARRSQRQLQEVMVQFWENHFDTVVIRGNNDVERHNWTMLEWDENSKFRANALGYFGDLVTASAKSQAMMYYLDNWRSTAFTLNENYARELLELHTLGVDCGYDQTDVEEVTRIFTGWTGDYLPGADPDLRFDILEDNGFLFRGRSHDELPKQALGYTFSAGGGIGDGERFIEIAAVHPCTARFISTKLIEVFATDRPSTEFVDRVASVFLNSGGHIGTVLETIFQSPEFSAPENFQAKVRQPIEFTIGALRATDAFMGTYVNGAGETLLNREINTYIRLEGQLLFDYPIPEGYDEIAEDWINGNGFLQRWRFTDRLAFWYPSGGRGTSIDPMTTVTNLGLTSAEAVVDHFAGIIAGPGLDVLRRQRYIATLTAGTGVFDPAAGGQETRLRTMISHLLGSPEFNKQ
jgi:uncharacterized protein (DUF1800 family)